MLRDADGLDDTFGTMDDDARLLASSPAIDTGTIGELPVGVLTDIDGGPRLIALEVDRGAFEFSLAGDGDGDGDVDADDQALFTECLSGPIATPVPDPPTTLQICLLAYDFDGDADVDLGDFATLQSVADP